MKKIITCMLSCVLCSFVYAGFLIQMPGGVSKAKVTSMINDHITADDHKQYVSTASYRGDQTIETNITITGDLRVDTITSNANDYIVIMSSTNIPYKCSILNIHCSDDNNMYIDDYANSSLAIKRNFHIGSRENSKDNFWIGLGCYRGYKNGKWSWWVTPYYDNMQGLLMEFHDKYFNFYTWEGPQAGNEITSPNLDRIFDVVDDYVRVQRLVCDKDMTQSGVANAHAFYDPVYFYDNIDISGNTNVTGILTCDDISVHTGEPNITISTSIAVPSGATVDNRDISKIIMKSDGAGNLSEQTACFVVYGSTLCLHTTTGWTTTYIQLSGIDQIENVQITPVGNYYTVCHLYDVYISSFGIINRDNTYDVEVNYIVIAK